MATYYVQLNMGKNIKILKNVYTILVAITLWGVSKVIILKHPLIQVYDSNTISTVSGALYRSAEN